MNAGPLKLEKRNRPPVSCEPCRTTKLKCNRALPCDTCIRRNKSSACTYAANANRNKPTVSKQRDLKDRLNVLENLVSSIVSGDATIQHKTSTRNEEDRNANALSMDQDNPIAKQDSSIRNLTDPDNLPSPENPHLQETKDGQVNYIDPSHWLSILNDIKEVREHLATSSPSIAQSTTGADVSRVTPDASLLLGPNEGAKFDGILRSLPSQPICDMLLSWYFNARFMVLGVIHPAKFQDEYAAFRRSPSTAPPLWVALLFSVLSISVVLRRMSNITEPEGSIPPVTVLQQGATQCLVLGRYATANAHALEALILHLQSIFFSNNDLGIDPWFEMGTIIHLAFRMGYHRDPRNLSGISPFDGEMRRRVWLNIFQIDALLSFQMGFPSMIPTDYCDVEVPRNLQYSDLHADMTSLPPSRPLSESTPVLYTICKASVMAVFKKIVALTQSLSPPSWDNTCALDAEMNWVYNLLPERMKRRDVSRSLIDHSCLILERCTIEILYLKGLIILHRRYITYEPQSPRFKSSRSACVDAALDVLSRQADLYKASEPGGRLYEDRWMVFSIHVNDFLLAAMVVCLDLSVRMRFRSGDTSSEWEYQERVGGELRALQTSQQIWAVNSAASPEAHVASLALGLMIKKVADNDCILPMVEDGWGDGKVNLEAEMEVPYLNSMSHMIDGSESIDWALLDQYFQNIDATIPAPVL